MKTLLKTTLAAALALNVGSAAADHLMSTQWTQKAPYNQSCPLNRNSEITPPGCAAVAVGQILFYHEPAIGAQGSVDYTYNVTYAAGDIAEEHLSLDLESLEIDPALILDTYKAGSYTDAQAEAVSNFLFRTGAGMFMQYRVGGSSPKNVGTQLWGMHHHLNVSPRAISHYRENYSTAQWREMIDRQLEQGKPVYYGGGWYHYASDGSLVRVGHYFVIDGKNADGTYSINWGNGYAGDSVDLEQLNQNPVQPYIGGQAVSYHTRQCMIADLVPASDGEIPVQQALMCIRPLVLNDDAALEEVNVGADRKFSLSFRIQHYSDRAYDEIFDGVGLWKEGEDYADERARILENAAWKSGAGLQPGFYRDVKHNVIVPVDLEDGDYYAHLMSRNPLTGKWQKMLGEADPSFTLSKHEGKTVVRVPHNYQGPSALWLREEIEETDNPYGKAYPGKVLNMRIVNTSGNNFQDSLRVKVKTAREQVELPYYMSVYEGCEMNLHYLIPQNIIDLDGCDYSVEVEYYDAYRQEYRLLGVGEDSALSSVVNRASSPSEDESYTIFNVNGLAVRAGKGVPSLSALSPGIYIVRQGNTSRKVVCR